MKKSSITGWQDVFSFTLIQTLKSKAFIISYILFLAIALISMPLINMITNGDAEDDNKPNPIQKVYVNNETSLSKLQFSKITDNEYLSHITFETMQEDYSQITKRIEETEEASVVVTIKEDNGMYTLAFAKSSDGSISDSNLQALGEAVVKQFDSYRIETLGITPEQLAMLQAPVSSNVTLTDTNGQPIFKVDTSISNSEYWFIYGIWFVVLMVNTMASSQVASSIVTEKSTRVIEYLLTSVKPLAVMAGKILAMLVAVLLQMVSMVVVLFISNTITASFSSDTGESLLAQYLPTDIFQSLNLINIILCFILVVFGLIFYATLAGLSGATVSRMEEMGEGLMLFTFTNLIGAYIGMGAAGVLMGSGENAFTTFAFLFPLSSPFILPGAILIGKASLWIIVLALLLQILFIFLLLKFVAKVYEILILHNGNTIKIKDLIKIFKTV